jgi:hypothetical protein
MPQAMPNHPTSVDKLSELDVAVREALQHKNGGVNAIDRLLQKRVDLRYTMINFYVDARDLRPATPALPASKPEPDSKLDTHTRSPARRAAEKAIWLLAARSAASVFDARDQRYQKKEPK